MLWTASRRLRRVRAPVVICWDLDNTLVDTGSLLRAGRPLTEAVAIAEPMPGMLAFVTAVRAALPGAAHVVLSVRTRGMRSDTLAWLHRHDVAIAPAAVCLAPSAESKPVLWRQLAAGARLVVVDDLAHGHETGALRSYDDLVAQAERIADVYLGRADVVAIGGDPDRARTLAGSVADRLA